MGAWGYKVLQNDYACDELSRYLTTDPLRNFVLSLFDNGDQFEILLGVAIVDASINGADPELLGGWGDYQEEGKEFFNNLPTDPLTDLVPDAVRELKRCIKSGTDDWSTDTAEERMDLYYTYLDRLTGV
jgi:hypothetical protein